MQIRNSELSLVETIHLILRNIREANVILEISKDQCKYTALQLADYIYSIPQIEIIINSSKREGLSDEQKVLAKNFLSERWPRIANTMICPTINTEHPINWICDTLAELCDPAQKMHLQMPTVSVFDLAGNDLNKLNWGSFIITDDLDGMVVIEDFIDDAVSLLKHSEVNAYVRINQQGKTQVLSSTELNRLGCIHDKLESLRAELRRPRNTTKLYDELVKLREGLLKGDVNHHGQEMDAAREANIAISQFFIYYSTFSQLQKIRIRKFGQTQTLGYILDHLARPPEKAKSDTGGSVTYCLVTLGRYLDGIISTHNAELRNMTPAGVDYIENEKNRLKQLAVNQRLSTLKEKLLVSEINFVDTSYKVIEYFIQRDEANSSYDSDKQTFRSIYLTLAKFVAGECQSRVSKRQLDIKLKCYINLLSAIGYEALEFNSRPVDDNMVVIKEIIKRTDMLARCRNMLLVHISVPPSLHRWHALVENHSDLGLLVYAGDKHIRVNNLFTHDNYMQQYNALSQKRISNDELSLLRSKFSEQRIVMEKPELPELQLMQPVPIRPVRTENLIVSTMSVTADVIHAVHQTGAVIDPVLVPAPVSDVVEENIEKEITATKDKKEEPVRVSSNRNLFFAVSTTLVAATLAVAVYRFSSSN